MQTLSPFISPGADPARPVLDDYNIQTLRALVETGGGQ
jgi:hypothetical protein